MENWLTDRGIDNVWEFSPTLTDLGFEDEQLESLAKDFSPDQLPEIISWLGASFTVYSLLAEISQGATRISEIVRSLKTYVYLDQAPVQEVDLHEGIDNTLIMLRHKLKKSVLVKREFSGDIPKIQAFGSELNQVWTNIIDNAIDAMDGKGDITIRTRRENDWVIVEIEDNGPGIPDDIQDKIFSPFFTTKSVGKGTGLGLNITYNIIQKHAGEIKLYSRPGKTRFQICLPIDFEKIQPNNNPVSTMNINDDGKLLNILENVKNLAVVGISDNKDQPNNSVPAFLQAHQYHIIPVNPNLKEVLGEKAYPDLLSIPVPVDLVLIFRRSEFVPEIVDQAVKIGAKVVWMQEGIVNEMAAVTAIEAGLDVVMDTCMRATHRRLIGSD
jgi:predicted CoA-binding protein/two-component sensor histidine kinase